jgi:hypothetical protein
MKKTESSPQMEDSLSGHKASDVNIRGVVVFTVGLIIVIVVIYLVVWGTFDYFAAREGSRDTPLSPLAGDAATPVPPAPQLQSSPSRELHEMRAEEDALLHSYRWVDQQAGIVGIPIERAMRLLAEREKGD